MKKSYVGVTGFMRKIEVEIAIKSFSEHIGDERDFMVGVLASAKTLTGKPHIKFPNRYPTLQEIPDLFFDDSRVLNLLHYGTRDPSTLLEDLIRLTKTSGKNMHGFQLNAIWPSLKTIKEYKKLYPKNQIVLQIGSQALKEINDSSEELVSKVKEYDRVVEYLLLDPSGGKRISLDPNIMRGYLDSLTQANLSINIGIAGGLCAETLGSIELLLRDFPGLSIDAEGCLRDKSDDLHMSKVNSYFREFSRIKNIQ